MYQDRRRRTSPFDRRAIGLLVRMLHPCYFRRYRWLKILSGNSRVYTPRMERFARVLLEIDRRIRLHGGMRESESYAMHEETIASYKEDLMTTDEYSAKRKK